MEVRQNPKVKQFIESLEPPAIAKVIRALELLENFGSMLSFPHCKKIGKGLFELRIRGRQEVRIFYTFHKGCAYLLHGFVKKSQKMPTKELRIALTKLNLLTLYNI